MAAPRIAVIGAGPAGLIAAETLAAAGCAVELFDGMASPARKLLIAGRGGLNLTHTEPLPSFLARYGAARPRLEPAIAGFPPDTLRAWCEGLDQPLFVGSSGRVFPVAFKAAPLLRAWLGRLAALGVRLHSRHRWLGWRDDGLLFSVAGRDPVTVRPAATLLALGGASWPRLGSDGAWTEIMRARGVGIAPWRPANCGVRIAWSPHLLGRHEGAPLKRVALHHAGHRARGEAVLTRDGLEGGAVYALAAELRRTIDAEGEARLDLDLRPDLEAVELARRLALPRRGQSLANVLRRVLGLSPVAAALLREGDLPGEPAALAARIKAVPLRVTGTRGLERAISAAGGIAWDELTERFELRRLPGVFAAGEMIDWEAPTGGYLLQAAFATGVAAARGVLAAVAPLAGAPDRSI